MQSQLITIENFWNPAIELDSDVVSIQTFYLGPESARRTSFFIRVSFQGGIYALNKWFRFYPDLNHKQVFYFPELIQMADILGSPTLEVKKYGDQSCQAIFFQL